MEVRDAERDARRVEAHAAPAQRRHVAQVTAREELEQHVQPRVVAVRVEQLADERVVAHRHELLLEHGAAHERVVGDERRLADALESKRLARAPVHHERDRAVAARAEHADVLELVQLDVRARRDLDVRLARLARHDVVQVAERLGEGALIEHEALAILDRRDRRRALRVAEQGHLAEVDAGVQHAHDRALAQPVDDDLGAPRLEDVERRTVLALFDDVGAALVPLDAKHPRGLLALALGQLLEEVERPDGANVHVVLEQLLQRPEDVLEIGPLNPEHGEVGLGEDVGRAQLACQQRALAKVVARFERHVLEGRPARARRRAASVQRVVQVELARGRLADVRDDDRARLDHEEFFANRTFRDDARLGGELEHLDGVGHLRHLVLRHAVQEVDALERSHDRFCALHARHDCQRAKGATVQRPKHRVGRRDHGIAAVHVVNQAELPEGRPWASRLHASRTEKEVERAGLDDEHALDHVALLHQRLPGAQDDDLHQGDASVDLLGREAFEDPQAAHRRAQHLLCAVALLHALSDDVHAIELLGGDLALGDASQASRQRPALPLLPSRSRAAGPPEPCHGPRAPV